MVDVLNAFVVLVLIVIAVVVVGFGALLLTLIYKLIEDLIKHW